MMEERLRNVAYNTALTAATANGKGVVGLGRRSDGMQVLHFLAPMGSPKYQIYEIIHDNSNNTIAASSTPTTEESQANASGNSGYPR